jgi:uncharacterized membrane-anchored protein YhcB (DUF1043 family)
MIIYILLSISFSANVILGFVIYNLLRKLESHEDVISELEKSNEEYELLFDDMKQTLNNSASHMRQIDRLGSFESDDETGFVFKELKGIVEQLNERF